MLEVCVNTVVRQCGPRLALGSTSSLGDIGGVRQQPKRPQAGHKEVFPAAVGHELRQAAEALADGLLGDSEHARPVIGPTNRIFLTGCPNEGALIDPLTLDKLELPRK